MLRALKQGVRWTVNRFGYDITPVSIKGNGYIDCAQTVSAASAKGMSVREYVEEMWNIPGRTDRTIEQMRKAGSLVHCKRVCEIGPGTGVYLERVIEQVSPEVYDVYETADDWASWITQTYGERIVRQPADGHTLRQTPSGSAGLVHAHSVFVYLKLLHAFEYFTEMTRICLDKGYIVFDFFSEETFPVEVVNRWLESPDRYPVVLPYSTVLRFFEGKGFQLVHQFTEKCGPSSCQYVVLKKTG